MNITVVISHPAHVHFFKYFIREMKKKGHNIFLFAIDKDVTIKLLENYNFDYIKIGNYGGSYFKKIVNMIKIDYRLYTNLKNKNIDVLTGIGSMGASHVAKLLRKPCIIFNDTEYSGINRILYEAFSDYIVTPKCFEIYLGKKQITYDGYQELAYLHPNWYKPDPNIIKKILNKDTPIIFIRFVEWKAVHDIGHKGINNRKKLVMELSKLGTVLISSEGIIEPELEKYKITIPPEKLHDLLFYSTLFVGEGGATAAESAILGTHTIKISSRKKQMGIFNDLQKYDILYVYDDDLKALSKAYDLLQNKNLIKEGKEKRDKIINDTIDVTKFMIELFENKIVTKNAGG